MEITPELSRLEQALTQIFGLVLKPATPTTLTTCAKCRGFKNPGFKTCFNCSLESGCDTAGFCTYAVYDSQMMRYMYDYKRPSHQNANNVSRTVIASLLLSKLSRHLSCCEKKTDMPLNYWTNVPSTNPSSSRSSSDHQLYKLAADIIRKIKPGLRYIPLTSTLIDHSHSRVFRPDLYNLGSFEVTNAHILLMEDTWVSGFHVESVAQMLKDAGAAKVSTLCLARAVDPRYKPNQQLVEAIKNHALVFNPEICPWTQTGSCP